MLCDSQRGRSPGAFHPFFQYQIAANVGLIMAVGRRRVRILANGLSIAAVIGETRHCRLHTLAAFDHERHK
jgi:hypothetical protein